MLTEIYKVGGRGHSCGIYSFDDDHIDQLARLMPVSRMMVRQSQSKSNSGSFTNGMAMTSSMGCGIWGREHHQRERDPEALHADHMGQPADP